MISPLKASDTLVSLAPTAVSLELPRKPRLPRIINFALFVLITRNRPYTEFVIFWVVYGCGSQKWHIV